MTLAFLNIGPVEIILLAIVGLLLFGRRLPEVGKNLGKGIVEFKKGLSGVEEDVNRAGAAQPPQQYQQPPQQLPPQQQSNLLQQSAASVQPGQTPPANAVNNAANNTSQQQPRA